MAIPWSDPRIKTPPDAPMKQSEPYERDKKRELIHRASAHLHAAFHIEKLARELPVSKKTRETVDKLGDSLRDKAVKLKEEADKMTVKIYSSIGCADAMCAAAERLEPPQIGYDLGRGDDSTAHSLPPCMMPDGGECCPVHHAAVVENRRLREALENLLSAHHHSRGDEWVDAAYSALSNGER